MNDPTIPASTLRQRASKSAAFRLAMEAEMTPAAPDAPEVSANSELEQFADAYVKAPSLKPIAGFISLDGKKYQVQQFNAMVDMAITAGLLR